MEQEKFVFVPLGIEIGSDMPTVKGDYLFTTGRSNRDFEFLVNALKDSHEKLYIACDSYHGTEEGDVTVDRDCYGDKMMKRMAESFCVMIPLKNPHISAGQLVILQAMRLGKPVIVTESDGIADYLQKGKNGLSVPKTQEGIMAAVNRLRGDDQLYETISRFSKQYFHKHHTISAMGKRVGGIIKDI